MYKILTPNNPFLSNYCQVRANNLRQVIDSFLNGKTFQLFVRNRRDVQIGVGTNTLTRRFLSYLFQGDTLDKYLALSYQKQVKIINIFKNNQYPNDLIFKPLCARIYDAHFASQQEPYDDFNEICYEIFVNQGYELIDKADFINSTGLKICPYCGKDEVIESIRSKRQIDHYLPKRKYPFFALNYFNLIPACDLCNEAPKKGTRDPIVEENAGNVIIQPYSFDDTIVRFHLDLLGPNIYKPENYDVKLGFLDKRYLDGYNTFFDLSERYKSCKQEIFEDYIRLMQISGNPFYNHMQMNLQGFDFFTSVLGYMPNTARPTEIRLYRLRKDLFEQLVVRRQPQLYYVMEYGNNPVSLE